MSSDDATEVRKRSSRNGHSESCVQNKNGVTSSGIELNQAKQPNSFSYGSKKLDNAVWAWQILMILGWSSAVLYGTYHTFLASEEFLPWNRDPVMNPSWLSSFLNRGKDDYDTEWLMFTSMYTSVYFLSYCVAYVILSQLLLMYQPKAQRWISPLFSYLLLKKLSGFSATNYMFFIPVIYWLVLRARNRFLVWVVAILLLLGLNYDLSSIVVTTESAVGRYYFHITTAWCISRGISYCFDTMDEGDATSLKGLCDITSYMFYFPLTITGPPILYNMYRNFVTRAESETRNKEVLKKQLATFSWKVFKAICWALIIEILLHYVYFYALALTSPALRRMNWWALGGIVYWLGQYFQMKYVVMYGIPSAIAGFDGLDMPPLPRCVAYIHRYSVMWKDFDRGLYYFLVQYLYKPSLQVLSENRFTKNWNIEIKRLLGSFFTFVYVWVWHSISYEVFVWAAFNFIGVTIERFGSCLKRIIDKKYNVRPAVWDVLVEPILCIPVAILAILNSSVFCGRLMTATVVTHRFLTESHYVVPVIFFFTNVGVAMRYWTKEKFDFNPNLLYKKS